MFIDFFTFFEECHIISYVALITFKRLFLNKLQTFIYIQLLHSYATTKISARKNDDYFFSARVNCITAYSQADLYLYFKTSTWILDCQLFPNLLEMWLPTHRLILFDFLFEKKIF